MEECQRLKVKRTGELEVWSWPKRAKHMNISCEGTIKNELTRKLMLIEKL